MIPSDASSADRECPSARSRVAELWTPRPCASGRLPRRSTPLARRQLPASARAPRLPSVSTQRADHSDEKRQELPVEELLVVPNLCHRPRRWRSTISPTRKVLPSSQPSSRERARSPPYSPLGHGFLTGKIRSPGSRRRRLVQDQPALHRGQLREEPPHRRRGTGRRFRCRRHTGAGRAGLAARAGQGHRPDPRHQARLPRRREHGSRQYRAERRADRTAQRAHPGHRRTPRGVADVRHRPLITSRGAPTFPRQ